MTTATQPSPRRRVGAAAAIGAALFALYLLYVLAHPGAGAGDFEFPLRAARLLLAGKDPYVEMVPGVVGDAGAFLYPLPAALIATPFAVFDSTIAGALFVGISAGLLTYALSASGWWRLLALMSPAFLLAFSVANWPPLIVASASLSGAGWLAAAKPNIGIVAFAYRPRWSTVLGGLGLCILGLLLVPTWPKEWLSHVARQEVPHSATFAWPLGFVGFAGLLRWRTPEGRALLAFTLIPVSAFPYDHLMLWLIPRTFREALLLTWTAWLTIPVLLVFNGEQSTARLLVIQGVLSLGTVVPATILVLRHPNAGPIPAWLERMVSPLPSWLRGSVEAPA